MKLVVEVMKALNKDIIREISKTKSNLYQLSVYNVLGVFVFMGLKNNTS